MVDAQNEVAADLLRRQGIPRGAGPVATPPAEALALVESVLPDLGRPAPSVAPDVLLAALTVLRHLREELASWEPRLITAARDRGASWASLAPALGVTSRQAAERRYLRLRPSAGSEATGEGRVRAERDRRAGDRAVEAWARRNSAVLRRLAGQISALDGLTGPAKQHVDLVGQALADDDPATLLAPLADSHNHLRASHAGLAEQIKSVTDHTDQLRRDTQQERSGAHPPTLPQ